MRASAKSMKGFPKHFEESTYYDWEWGKRVRRKARGKVEYEVVGTREDNSYRPSYNFTNYFIVLKRLTHGTKGRPIGSTTCIPESDYKYDFEEIERN